jgi:hypothetical protein
MMYIKIHQNTTIFIDNPANKMSNEHGYFKHFNIMHLRKLLRLFRINSSGVFTFSDMYCCARANLTLTTHHTYTDTKLYNNINWFKGYRSAF